MSKQSLLVRGDQPLRENRPGATEIVEPAMFSNPFFSFSLSVTEISKVGGRTRVRSNTTRLAEGRLVSEKFDGELAEGAFEQLAQQAREQAAAHVRLMFAPFTWFLPKRHEDE